MRDLLTSKKFILSIIIISGFAFTSMMTLLFYPGNVDLVIYFYYITASNSFLGLPHEPLIIYYGKIYPVYVPVVLAIVPTVLGCALDYIVLTPILDSKYLTKIKESHSYERSTHYFNKQPFWTLVVFALTPVPFYPVRLLSVATKYPFYKYASAVLLGRIPRYALLAVGGSELNIPDWVIFTFLGIMLGSPLAINGYRKLKNRREQIVLVDEAAKN